MTSGGGSTWGANELGGRGPEEFREAAKANGITAAKGVKVAVKGLPPEVSHNSDEMESVRENFQLVSELQHPNIAGVRTLEKDAKTGDYYLVMAYARGMSLKQWLAQAQRAPSDQYSLGVIAYQMFAGELPYDSDDIEILKHAVVFEGDPLSIADLNAFLRSHRVLKVDKAFAEGGWSFCVEWIEGENSTGDWKRKVRVDWKEKLEPEVFERFAKLRECRSMRIDTPCLPPPSTPVRSPRQRIKDWRDSAVKRLKHHKCSSYF